MKYNNPMSTTTFNLIKVKKKCKKKMGSLNFFTCIWYHKQLIVLLIMFYFFTLKLLKWSQDLL